MLALWILGISIVLQFTAAAMAIRLIKLTGLFWASFSLAAAVTLMGIRRSVTFYRVLFEGADHPVDLTAEIVALLISVFMVTGIVRIAPLFFSSRRAELIRSVGEEKFRALAQLTTDPCLVYDLRGRIVDANDAASRLLGYSSDELADLSIADVEPGWSRERIGELVKERRGGEPSGVPRELRGRDGSTHVATVCGRLIGGDEQRFLAVLRPV